MSNNSFCGADEDLWEFNIASSDYPKFSSCFLHGILSSIPMLWLWCSGVVYLLNTRHAPLFKTNQKLWNVLFLSRCVLSCSLLMILIVGVVNNSLNLADSDLSIWKAEIVFPVARCFTTMFFMYLTMVQRRRAVISSYILFIYWFLELITRGVLLYSSIVQNVSLWLLVTNILDFVVVVGLLLLSCFADNRPSTASEHNSPFERASVVSQLTMFWITPLICLGMRRQFSHDDICDVPQDDQSGNISRLFRAVWKRELFKKGLCRSDIISDEYTDLLLEKFVSSNKTIVQQNILDHISTNEVIEPLNVEIKKEPHLKYSHPSLILCILYAFGFELFKAQLFCLLADIISFSFPWLLQILIEFVQDSESRDFEMKGYILAISYFVLSFIYGISMGQWKFRTKRIALRVKVAISDFVYRKSLSIDRNKSNCSGKILNLLTADVDNFYEFLRNFPYLWSCPMTLIISIVYLYYLVGASIFIALSTLMFLIPANIVLWKLISKYEDFNLTFKDTRLKFIREVITAIKNVKLNCLESVYEEKLRKIRSNELNYAKKMFLCTSLSPLLEIVSPFLISAVTFGTYLKMSSSHVLTPSTAFASTVLIYFIVYSLYDFNDSLISFSQLSISISRLTSFFCQYDLDPTNAESLSEDGCCVAIDNGTFMWNSSVKFRLTGINLNVKEGELVAIIGEVGSGKSSLLSTFLGEMNVLEGSTKIKGTKLFMPQEAWIQNATIRDNILFGHEFEAITYDDVLHGCALKPDLLLFPSGDLTEIGDKGANLSGGQKQRVSLARTVYTEADLYIFDDPFSAIDIPTMKHVFHSIFSHSGCLKHKTRIVVTSSVQMLQQFDRIIMMANGSIACCGLYDHLIETNVQFKEFINFADVAEKMHETNDGSQFSDKSLDTYESLPLTATSNVDVQGVLVEDEQVTTGQVSWTVYGAYIKSVGCLLTCLVLVFFGLVQVTTVAGNIWLQKWTDSYNITNKTEESLLYTNETYLGVYSIFPILQLILFLLATGFASQAFRKGALRLHQDMTRSILRAPLGFFHANPPGRIINRFSKDIDDLDNKLFAEVCDWIIDSTSLLMTLVVMVYSLPIFLSVAIPVMGLFYVLQRVDLATSRQLKRLEANSRSPMYSYLSETLNGVQVIRAFGAQRRFRDEFFTRLDVCQKYGFTSCAVNTWLANSLYILADICVLAVVVFSVSSRTHITGGIVGLAIHHAMQLMDKLSGFICINSDIETSMVSVERIVNYTNLEQEPIGPYHQHTNGGSTLLKGKIEFIDYSANYRPGADLILKNVTFSVDPGEKIAIVGRTGSGKSSLLLALVRILNTCGGSIRVGDVDIRSMDLHHLRSQFTILDQDAVIFGGTLRDNLDPFSRHSDDEIWSALERVQAKSFVSTFPSGLDQLCDGDLSLSLGEKQLLCLASAFMRQTEIFLLDEATAFVDVATDQIIQKVIQSNMKNCTVLCVTHKLDYITNYDRVLVVDEGRVVELNDPRHQCNGTNGVFRSFVGSSEIIS